MRATENARELTVAKTEAAVGWWARSTVARMVSMTASYMRWSQRQMARMLMLKKQPFKIQIEASLPRTPA